MTFLKSNYFSLCLLQFLYVRVFRVVLTDLLVMLSIKTIFIDIQNHIFEAHILSLNCMSFFILLGQYDRQ